MAIDGPAGAGKSTVAKMLATVLGFAHVDTGALYRLAALVAIREGTDDQELGDQLDPDLMRLLPNGQVFLGDEDVTNAIRTPEVSQKASHVAQLGSVRRALLALQRELGRKAVPGAVLEGRDIGTIVFPDAQLKIFLSASAGARAERRLEDLRSQGTEDATLSRVLEEIKKRDTRDETRDLAPLVPAEDAIEIDSTGLSVEQVTEKIAALCRKRQGR